MSSHSSALGERHHQPILACQQVAKVFHSNQQSSFTALEDINLEVARGDFVTILGRSGGGKSTLLKLLGGFIPPTSGQVLFHGEPLPGITPKIGMVFQENTLYPWLTVEQNIGFGFKVRGKQKCQYTLRVQEVMEHVGLGPARHLYPHQLSGGMKQRVSIARSLANQPDVLLLDEPFSALDIQLRRRLQKFLLNIWQDTKEATLVLVTHNVEEAILLGQKLIVVGGQPGQIIEAVDISAPAFSDRYDRHFLDLQQHLEKVVGEEPDMMENPFSWAANSGPKVTSHS
ncbi:nitrate ABC transporter ATP-binding protein [filamentous cyanobacterium CCT1]|nr:nitrate ABC transporter ATP-binding protein [filamentous cyanobacterium CCT1]PSN80104.1 nitrate ABC transporter ATP-binding protein [filamentous cyanobacterium CCP4]